MKHIESILGVLAIVVFIALLCGAIYAASRPQPHYDEVIVFWNDEVIEGKLLNYDDYENSVEVNVEGIVIRTSWNNAIFIRYENEEP